MQDQKYSSRFFNAHHFRTGLSLIEMLIYLAIFSGVLLVLYNLFFVTSRIRAVSNATLAINENARVSLSKIRDSILDASAASVSGTCPENKLNLTISSVATTYQVTNGILEVVIGTNPAQALSSSLVIAGTNASCLFTIITNPAPAKRTVQIQLRITYNTPDNPLTYISQDYENTVSLR